MAINRIGMAAWRIVGGGVVLRVAPSRVRKVAVPMVLAACALAISACGTASPSAASKPSHSGSSSTVSQGSQSVPSKPLPAAPASAMLTAYSRTESASTVQFSIHMAITGLGSAVASNPAVAKTLGAVGNMTITGGENFAKHEGYVNMSLPPGSVPAATTGTGAASGTGASTTSLNTSMMFTGSNIYIKSPVAVQSLGKSWVEMSISQLARLTPASQQGGFLNFTNLTQPFTMVQVLKDMANTQVTKDGSSTLNGVAVTEYTATIDLSNVQAAAGAGSSAQSFLSTLKTMLGGASTAVVNVWIDNAGRVRQIEMDVPKGAAAASGKTPPQVPVNGKPTSLGTPTVALTIKYFGYGQPLHFSLPPASQVMNVSQLAGKVPVPSSGALPGIGGASTPAPSTGAAPSTSSTGSSSGATTYGG